MEREIININHINLSIIIPHYNSIKTLEKLLNTIPEGNDIQIIVVDDNSDEMESYMLLKRQRESSNILFLQNDSGPKGAGTCRNIGIAAAKGEWLTFADADDYFLEGFYEVAKRYFDSDYDAVFFSPTSIDLTTGDESDRHSAYVALIENVLLKGDPESELRFRYEYYVPWSKMIRRDFIINNNILFDEVLASNDIMFSNKVGYYMKHYHISREKIYCVTKGRNTLTKTVNKSIYFSRLDVLVRRNHFLHQRLNQDDFTKLEFKGGGMVANCVLYKLGFRCLLKTILILRKNRVKIWNQSLSIHALQRKIKEHKNRVMQEKKYQ